MIYFLYGSDVDKSRNKLHELVQSLVSKKPDATHIKVTDEHFTDYNLEELIGGQGLFSQKAIIEMDKVLQNKDAKELILERIKDIAESDNIFIFLEGMLDVATLKKFDKHALKIQEFKGEEVEKKRDTSLFILADALGRKDKKQLWVLYNKAKAKDISPEEIHGILFWQVKNIIISISSKTAKEAGLNPFVYGKAVAFARNYSLEELVLISSKLITVYHNARRGIVEFDNALESFILEM